MDSPSKFDLEQRVVAFGTDLDTKLAVALGASPFRQQLVGYVVGQFRAGLEAAFDAKKRISWQQPFSGPCVPALIASALPRCGRCKATIYGHPWMVYGHDGKVFDKECADALNPIGKSGTLHKLSRAGQLTNDAAVVVDFKCRRCDGVIVGQPWLVDGFGNERSHGHCADVMNAAKHPDGSRVPARDADVASWPTPDTASPELTTTAPVTEPPAVLNTLQAVTTSTVKAVMCACNICCSYRAYRQNQA